ncbi:MAG: flagellar hook-basal body complex protein FliE [Holosporales bacterium]|jgi:flagellar hook-basal body complex protein FliE|nr:flagellar hook-basal body complex protein FliE [Holosporales bacterium]
MANPVKKESTGISFADVLKEELWTTPRERITQAENLIIQATIDPGINKLQFVTALTDAEIELQKMTTVFAKAQEAYDKIAHMPL